MTAKGSRELLDRPSETAFPYSLLVCRTTDQRGGTATATNADYEARALAAEAEAAAVPRSQVLDKVKDFLGVIARANDKLELDVRQRSRADYDVEVLSGNEKAYIEMDLLLGVADLHNDEAVAAAEASMSGVPPPSMPATDHSSSDTDDYSNGEMEASCGSEKKRKRNERPKIIMLDPSSNQS